MPTSANATAKQIKSAKLHILVVEDCEPVRRSYERLLGTVGEVTSAANGVAAMQLILAGARFDAIISDLNMAGGDGRTFFKELKANAPELCARMLICTASRERDLAESMGIVEDRVLRKPVSATLLLDTVAVLLSPLVGSAG